MAEPNDQKMDSVVDAVGVGAGSTGASTYYPLDSTKPSAGQVYRKGNIYWHGDIKTCKLCSMCTGCALCKDCDISCDKCMKCECHPACAPCQQCRTCSCIPGCDVSCNACMNCECHPACAPCQQCKTCSCIPGCDVSCKACMACKCHPTCEKICAICDPCRTCSCIPGCKVDCLSCQTCNCHPSCAGKCPDCDMSCEACLKCGCHPACSPCLALCQCTCGPEVELKAVGCELCPGPLQNLCGNWHVSTSRFPMPLPAIIFPCCCGPMCPQVPCPGGKDEVFENNDFKEPGTVRKTDTIPWVQVCCPNLADMVSGMIPKSMKSMPGFKSAKGSAGTGAADSSAAPEDVVMDDE